jgi:hypothetical protein
MELQSHNILLNLNKLLSLDAMILTILNYIFNVKNIDYLIKYLRFNKFSLLFQMIFSMLNNIDYCYIIKSNIFILYLI